MKTVRRFAKLISAALVLCLAFALASCGGKLKLESFSVDRSSVKTVYEIGEKIDFSGIRVMVKYSDESLNTTLTFSDLKITYAENITAEAGTKNVTVSYDDPNLEEKLETTVQITVEDGDAPAVGEDLTVTQFEKNENLVAFESDNKTTGKHNYGEPGFSGEFINGGILYVIGDDNTFHMSPDFTVMDKDGMLQYLKSFYSVVDIYVYKNESYVLLDKSATSDNVYTYSLDGEAFATVNTYKGEYSFTKPIDRIKISVMPSPEHYKGTEDLSPVVLEAKVIDAYNVYEAWQLAVIDNYSGRDDWDVFKNEHGIAGIRPSGIVIHSDIHISADDVPSSFFNVSDKEVIYTNTVTGENKVAKKGTKYLIDGTVLYEYESADEFVIEGNFFTIDLKNFPLIASPAVFDASLELDYGSDYSNAVLMRFNVNSSNWTKEPADVPYININNIAFIGNASRDNWVDAKEALVSAGGLILVKSGRHAYTTLDNVLNNSFFISYFPDYTGHMTVKNSKCYDSYQNAAFVWSDSTLTVDNTYMNGSGGPVIISQSVKDSSDNYRNPVVTVTGSKLETALTGEEIWFKAVGATSLISGIRALGNGINQALTSIGQSGNWTNSDSKMNIKAILMPEGNTAAEALTDIMIQGTVTTDGTGIDRWYTSDPWGNILASFSENPELASAPFLTVYDGTGTAHTIFLNGSNFYDLEGNALGTQASHAALLSAFASADEILMTQGGLTVLFEFYHE